MCALKTTVLTGYEMELGAKMVPCAGWNTALHYSEGATAEHLHTRSECSVFDLCSYGKFRVAGKGAALALDGLFVRPTANLAVGHARRNLLLSAEGGVLDMPLVLRMADEDFLIVSGTETSTAAAAALSALAAEKTLEYLDLSLPLACLGVEGPETKAAFAELGVESLPEQGCCQTLEVDGFRAIATRAGLTGEDGMLLLFNVDYADQLWDLLLETASVMPTGFAALDSLRTEKGYPACGSELTVEFSPLESGLGGVIRLDDSRDFYGKTALLARKQGYVLVGLEQENRRAARAGARIRNEKEEIVGMATSGCFCPAQKLSISFCRIALEHLPQAGDTLWGEVADAWLPGVVCELPSACDGVTAEEFFLP